MSRTPFYDGRDAAPRPSSRTQGDAAAAGNEVREAPSQYPDSGRPLHPSTERSSTSLPGIASLAGRARGPSEMPPAHDSPQWYAQQHGHAGAPPPVQEAAAGGYRGYAQPHQGSSQPYPTREEFSRGAPGSNSGGRSLQSGPSSRGRAGSGSFYAPYPEPSRSPPASPSTAGAAGRRRRSRGDTTPSAYGPAGAAPVMSAGGSRAGAPGASYSSAPGGLGQGSAPVAGGYMPPPPGMGTSFAIPTGMPAVPRPSQSADASGAGSSSQARARPPESTAPKALLEGISRVRNGWRYKLVVVQHPSRARMCGFGDKDRRPLSPTLIVKLIITDEATGEDVPPWDVNTSLFFLASDLCHPDELMASPRNVLVHHHAATVPASSLQQPAASASDGAAMSASVLSPAPQDGSGSSGGSGGVTPSGLPSLNSLNIGRSRSSSDGRGEASEYFNPAGVASGSLTTITTESYTRNLVGAAVASANVLKDEQDVFRIFFVLQDLSVRTEGSYRIKLVFADLSQDGQTNDGVSNALAEAYTEPFTVYSPRRFPGMHDPTELSKKLAAQGVKIATRSDRKKRRRDSAGPSGGGGGDGAEGGEDEEDE